MDGQLVELFHSIPDEHKYINSSQLEMSEQCSYMLWDIAAEAEGLSGRTLRKLPFIAFSNTHHGDINADKSVCLQDYLKSLDQAVRTCREENRKC